MLTAAQHHGVTAHVICFPHAGGSVRHHYLESYMQSLKAICKVQFSVKGHQNGAQSVLALVQSNHCLGKYLEGALGMTAAEMEKIIR